METALLYGDSPAVWRQPCCMETALLYGDSPDGGESPDVLVVERSPGEVLVREEVVLWLGTLPYIARAWQHLQIQRDSYT